MGLIFSTKGQEEKQEPKKGKTIFTTRNAPDAIGPYSKAYRGGELLFCSGQIAIDPSTGQLISGDIEDETRQVCRNITGVLREYKLGLKDVVKTTVYVKNIEDFDKVNDIYKEYFLLKPARTLVEVSNLPKGASIEIEVIAKPSF